MGPLELSWGIRTFVHLSPVLLLQIVVILKPEALLQTAAEKSQETAFLYKWFYRPVRRVSLRKTPHSQPGWFPWLSTLTAASWIEELFMKGLRVQWWRILPTDVEEMLEMYQLWSGRSSEWCNSTSTPSILAWEFLSRQREEPGGYGPEGSKSHIRLANWAQALTESHRHFTSTPMKNFKTDCSETGDEEGFFSDLT